MKFNSAGPVGKMGQNFDRFLFPQFEAPGVGDLQYMLKYCG